MSRPRLGDLLVDAGVIDEMQLEAALGEQGSWGQRLGQTLLHMGVLDEETLVRTLARQLSIPVVWLRGKRIKQEVIDLVPVEMVHKHRILPVLLDKRSGKTLVLAMEDPCDLDVIDTITHTTGLPVKPALASPGELDDAINRHVAGDPGDSLIGAQFVAGPTEDSGPESGPELVQMHNGSGLAPLPPLEQPREDPVAGSSETVVRALAQLLVEKGVFTREELIARLGALGAK